MLKGIKLTKKYTYRRISDNNWDIEIQENGETETKELFLEFPPDALNQIGWEVGDTLIWEELDHGGYRGYSVRKKDEDEP